MKIVNKALANVTLSIAGDDVTGDGDGVFEVSEKAAKMLLGTPGWSQPKKAAPLPDEPPAAVDEGAADDDTEEVDLETLTKAELVSLAEEQGVNVDARATKAEIKAALEDALGE